MEVHRARPTPKAARRRRASVLCIALLTTILITAEPALATQLFTDDFESGGLSAWSTVQTSAGGAAVVQGDTTASGAFAVRVTATSTAGSLAYLRRSFATPQADLTFTADVRVEAEGASGGNVPLLRLFDATGARLVSLYRQNQASDKIYVQHSGTFNQTTGLLPLNTWARVSLHVVTAGPSAGQVQATLNGTTIYSTTTASIGNSGPLQIQIGNEVAGQAFRLAADNVVAGNGSGDTTPPETSIDAGPSGTVASGSATFAFSATEAGTFECSLDAASWTACSSPWTVAPLAGGAHQFAVRAIDAAGNIDPSPATRDWTVDFGGGCDVQAPPPSTTDPGSVVLADGFESGGLSSWNNVVQQGDATAGVQQDNVHAGRCALRLHVTTKVWASRANVSKALPVGTSELWADGWFDVEVEGTSRSWNTPTFRVFTNGRRVFDVSRQNGDGNFFVRYPDATGTGWTIPSTGRRLSTQRWYHIKIHLIANGNLSTAEVWLDGALVYRTTAATLGVSSFDLLMVGSEHQDQEGDVAVDDVVAKVIVPPPSATVFADGFESGNLAAWSSVTTAGGASATVQSGTVRSGSFAAQISTGSSGSSVAYVRKTFAAVQADLTTTLDVRVAAEGGAGGVAPLLTLNDAGGSRLVSVVRDNASGNRISVQHPGGTAATTGSLPLDAWTRLSVHTIAMGAGASTIEVRLDGVLIYATATADLGPHGVKTIQIGSNTGSKGYTVLVDDVQALQGSSGPTNDPRYKLLIADYYNRRLLITDFDGNIVWKFDNPMGTTASDAGPIGVRWLPGNQILATFGGGAVGVIDVATKSWVWRVKGYGGDWFQSPYDAELLPGGLLAVAMRFNDGGRVSVYDRTTGNEVWRHLLSNAHSVHYRTAAESYNSPDPTLLIGGWGAVREVRFVPGSAQTVTWQVKSEYTHEAIVVDNDRVLTTEGYYIQLVDRNGTQIWKRMTPAENRRMVVNPNFGGGYVWTVGEGDRIEFRDANGFLLREWSRLSDDTQLDYPYGVQVVQYAG